MPEEPKQTPEPEKPAEAPAPAGPTNAELAEGIRMANMRSLAAERAAMIAAGINRPMQAPTPTPVDPLDKWSQEDIVMSPEDKKRHLRAAITQGAQEESNRLRQEMAQAMALERQAIANQTALDMVVAQRPELTDPKNSSNFGAALTKVKMEADAAGINLSPAQMAQRAATVYDEIFRKPNGTAPMPPRLEGPNRTDLSQLPGGIEIVTHQSMLEKKYGLKKGSVREMYDSNDGAAIDSLNKEYLVNKNGPLFKRGALTNIDQVRMTMDSPDTES